VGYFCGPHCAAKLLCIPFFVLVSLGVVKLARDLISPLFDAISSWGHHQACGENNWDNIHQETFHRKSNLKLSVK
jgi:hypothetical protein